MRANSDLTLLIRLRRLRFESAKHARRRQGRILSHREDIHRAIETDIALAFEGIDRRNHASLPDGKEKLLCTADIKARYASISAMQSAVLRLEAARRFSRASCDRDRDQLLLLEDVRTLRMREVHKLEQVDRHHRAEDSRKSEITEDVERDDQSLRSTPVLEWSKR